MVQGAASLASDGPGQLASAVHDAALAGPHDLGRLNRRLAVATLAALCIAIASVFMRPLWRDEYWSLYFSDPQISLYDLIRSRLRTDIHPPLYYVVLQALRLGGVNAVALRGIQLGALIGTLCLFAYRRRGAQETVLYALMLVSGYWSIFYVVELRPYLLDMLFVVGSLAATQTVLERSRPGWSLAALILVAAAGAFTDYFVALWMGLLGGVLALVLVRRGQPVLAAAVLTGAGVALIPTLLWIKYSLPIISAGGDIDHVAGVRAMLSGLNNGLIQTARAVTKSLASNVAFTIAGAMGLRALFRKRDDFDVVLAATSLALVAGALCINTLWAPILKERALIVLAPPLAVLGARAVTCLPATKWPRRLIFAMPILAAITPLLFAGEYFKDRENLSGVRKTLAAAGACADQPVLTLYPKSSLPDFAVSFTTQALAGVAQPNHGSVRLIDASRLHNAPMPASTCRIKALVLGLTRGEKADHEEARAGLRAAGVPLASLKELKLGGGRQRLFVSP